MSSQNGKNLPGFLQNKKKVTIIAIVLAILVLNVMWTMSQNKFAPKLDEVKASLAALEKRVEKIEQGGFANIAELKDDFAALKAVSENLSAQLSQSLKAEEDNLANLEAQLAAQKAKVEALKKLAE